MNHLQPSGVVDKKATEWLVSVRDRDEAELAFRFGVDIIDLKEPSAGPLAPVETNVWEELVRWRNRLASPVRLSAALGELNQATEIAGDLPAEFMFAKAGPSGCDRKDRLQAGWSSLRRSLAESTELVAVAYADHETAGTLAPELVLEAAAEMGFSRILLDTFHKDGRSSIRILGGARLARFGARVRRNGLWWSLAGGISLEDLEEIRQTCGGDTEGPDCIGIRGDACDVSREGGLSHERLAVWNHRLATPS